MKLLVKSVLALLSLLVIVDAIGGRSRPGAGGPPPWTPGETGLRKPEDPGFSLLFDGNDDFVDLGAIVLGGPMSFEFSILPRRDGPGREIPFLSFYDRDGKHGIEICYHSDNGNILVRLSDKSNVRATHTTKNAERAAFDKWNYYGITIDNTGGVEIYKENNGGKMKTSGTNLSGSKFVPTFTRRMKSFMGRDFKGNNFLKGQLDNIIIWTRVLGKDEFVRGRAIQEKSISLVAWWDLDQKTGFKATEFSLNHYHGILGGGNSDRSPRWVYSAVVPYKTCRIFDNLLAQTFDGRLLWFEIWRKTGIFWMSLSGENEEGVNDIAVQVALEQTRFLPISSVSGVAFKVGNYIIAFDTDFSDKPDSILTINGLIVNDDVVTIDEHSITMSKKRKGRNHEWTIEVPHTFKMHIKALPILNFAEVDLSVPSYYDQTKDFDFPALSGICGNFNGQRHDDDVDESWRVPNGQSFFEEHDFETIVAPNYTCNISQTLPGFENKAREVCGNTTLIDTDFEDACLERICISGSVESAIPFAEATFENCVQEWINANNGTSEEDQTEMECYEPCPNFCSFHGKCSEGVCTCEDNWGGRDCSQEMEFSCFKAKFGDDNEYVMEPLVGSASVKEHYHYGTPNWWSSNNQLGISQTTLLYLYQQQIPTTSTEEPENHLSLVIINDKAKDGTGGRVDLRGSFEGDDTNLQLRVRDDPSDKISFVNKELKADWRWWRCCTDGLAIGDLPADFNFTLNFSNKKGIDQIVISNQNHYGAQDLYGIEGDSLSITGDICHSQCGQHENCTSCTEDPNCGWCVDTETCALGTSGGPTDGYCSFWRFSTDPEESRVLTTSFSYPVEPSRIDAYLGSEEVDAKFSVTIPHPRTTSLDVMILQELSSKFSVSLQAIRTQMLNLFSSLREDYPWFRVGYASFIDFSPPSSLDYEYRLNLPLTNDVSDFRNMLQDLTTGHALNGKSQLEALRRLAEDESIGWRAAATRVVIVITESDYNSDGDYPVPEDVRHALLEVNIVPVFISTKTFHNRYQSLAANWEFGSAHVYSSLSLGSISGEISFAISQVISTAKAIPVQSANLQSITPVGGYQGLAPFTRVWFTATLKDDNSVGSAKLVIPGYGKVVITPTSSDLPIAFPCDNANVDSDQQVVLTLSGSSYYPSSTTPYIVDLPNGKLFQHEEDGSQGSEIQVGTSVNDEMGRVIFVPEATSGDYVTSFTFKMIDSCSGCSPIESCSIQVRSVGEVPIPAEESQLLIMDEDTIGKITLTTENVDSSELTVTITGLPAVGQLYQFSGIDDETVPALVIDSVPTELTQDNTVQYVPPRDQFGNETIPFASFEWVAKGPTGLFQPHIVTNIIVRPVNDPAIAIPDNFTVKESSSKEYRLQATQTWGEYDILTFFVDTTQTNGTVDLNSATGILQFTPTPRFRGATFFDFIVNDGFVNSSSARIDIQVIPVARVPIAIDSNVTTNENENVTIELEGYEEDGRSLTAHIVSWNGRGKLFQMDGTEIPKAAVDTQVISSEFKVVYVPPAYQHSIPPTPFTSFTFRLKSEDLQSQEATVSIHVTDVAHPPEAFPMGPIGVPQGNTTSFDLVGMDYNKDELKFFICSAPTEGSLFIFGLSSPLGDNDEVTGVTPPDDSFERTARVTYEAHADGQFDSFSFRAENSAGDSDCQLVTINVTHVNQAPTALPVDPPLTCEQDDNVTFTLRGEDRETSEADLEYHVTRIPDASHGTLFTQGGDPIESPSNVTQTLTFVPALGFFGVVYFRFRVADVEGLFSQEVRVDINVTQVFYPPVASDGNVTLDQFTNTTVTLIAIDSFYSPEELTFYIASLPSNGTLYSCDETSCSQVTDDPLASRVVLYVPEFEFFGSDSFTFFASNPSSLNSSEATVTLVVDQGNRSPVANPATTHYELEEGEERTIQLDGSDPDVGDEITFTIWSSSPNGQLLQISGEPIEDGDVVIDGELRFVAVGAPSATFTYRVTDKAGLWDSATLDFTITAGNQPPVATTESAIGEARSTLNITLGVTDSSPGSESFTYEFVITEAPPLGTLYQYGTETVISDGDTVEDPFHRVSFVGEAAYWGYPYSNFTYTVHAVNTGLTSSPRSVIISLEAIRGLIPVGAATIDDFVEGVGHYWQFHVLNRDQMHPDCDVEYWIATASDLGVNYQVAPNGTVLWDQEAHDHGRVTNPDGLVWFQPLPEKYGEAPFRLFVNETCTGQPEYVVGNTFGIRFMVIRNNTAPKGRDTTYNLDNHDTCTNNDAFALDASDREDDPIHGWFETYPEKGLLYHHGSSVKGDFAGPNTTFHAERRSRRFCYIPFNNTGFVVQDNYDNFTYCIQEPGNPELTNCYNVTLNIVLYKLPPDPRSGHIPEVYVDEDDIVTFDLNSTDINRQIVYVPTAVPAYGELIHNYPVFGGDDNMTVVAGQELPWLVLQGPPEWFRWRFIYTPPPDFNTHNSEPLEFRYRVYNFQGASSGTIDIHYPYEMVTKIFVNAVNDPPVIHSNTTVLRSYRHLPHVAFPALLTDIQIEDDAASEEILSVNVTCYRCEERFSSITFLDPSSFTGFEIVDEFNILANGTLAGINAAFAEGLQTNIAPPFWDFEPDDRAHVYVTVNDNGHTGSGGSLSETRMWYTALSWIDSVSPPDTGEAIIVAVGSAAVASLALFGSYKFLKKKNLIPEEADPWENDTLWDATFDNPLFPTDSPPALESQNSIGE